MPRTVGNRSKGSRCCHWHHDASGIDDLVYPAVMRTTVTLTPEAEALIQAAMAEGRSFKDVVNDAIVTALTPFQTRPFRTRTHTLGQVAPGYDELSTGKASALAGALEDIEIVRKREMGK